MLREAPEPWTKPLDYEGELSISDMPVEGNVINVATTPLWLKAGCIATLVVLAVIVTLVVTRWRRRKRDS